jgi:kynurenine 3-monooxygenase
MWRRSYGIIVCHDVVTEVSTSKFRACAYSKVTMKWKVATIFGLLVFRSCSVSSRHFAIVLSLYHYSIFFFLFLSNEIQFHIQLFDEQPRPPPSPTDSSVWGSTNLDRHYLIGLGGRGITSLQQFGVWEDIEKVAVPVPGRKDWNGKGLHIQPVETFKTERKFVTQVLPRDKLVSVLYHYIVQCQQEGSKKSLHYNDDINTTNNNNNNIKPMYNYTNVYLHYGYKVEPIDINNPQQVVVDIRGINPDISNESNDNHNNIPNRRFSVALLIAADGSARTFANEMDHHDKARARGGSNAADDVNNNTNTFRVIRYDDDNQKVYKNIAFRIPESWRKDINYAVRTERVIFDALPANDQGEYVGVLLLSKDDIMAQPNVDPTKFRQFLQDEIPQFVPYLEEDTVITVAKRPPSTLPMFRYVTPRMHHDNGRIVLLGDCAHTVKPYFGMGANSALEDVKLLSRCIDQQIFGKNNSGHVEDSDVIISDMEMLKSAIRNFSTVRSADIETLVRVSYSLDRPGVEGILTFLIPIIFDGIFSKILPQVFAPNVISILQNEEVTFREAVERKRRDRMGQIAIVSVVTAVSIYNLVPFIRDVMGP